MKLARPTPDRHAPRAVRVRRRLVGAVTLGAALLGCAALLTLSAAPGVAATGPTWVAQLVSGTPAPGPMVFGAAATSLGGGSAVFYGGENPGNQAASSATWLNSGGVWTPTCGTTVNGATQACGPGARTAMGMGTGPNGVILFGGSGAQLFNSEGGDTWQYNGTTWRRICDTGACGPTARVLPAMAGNGVRAVMYGGLDLNGGTALADTWAFYNETWHQICGSPTPCAPGPLAGASMAWDGSQFVLFGGTSALGGTTTVLDDTWVLDGTTWVRQCGTDAGKPCGPPGRVLAGFAYAHDNPGGTSGAIMTEGGNIFANNTDQVLRRDAWFWHDDAWTRLAVPYGGAPVRIPPSGGPPAGPDPLLGPLAAIPNSCQLVYAGTYVQSDTPPGTYGAKTYVFSRNRVRETTPTTCAEAPPPPTSASPSASVSAIATHTATASHSASAAATSQAGLPPTGAQHLPDLLGAAAVLLLVGGFVLWLAGRGPVSRYRARHH